MVDQSGPESEPVSSSQLP